MTAVLVVYIDTQHSVDRVPHFLSKVYKVYMRLYYKHVFHICQEINSHVFVMYLFTLI